MSNCFLLFNPPLRTLSESHGGQTMYLNLAGYALPLAFSVVFAYIITNGNGGTDIGTAEYSGTDKEN